MNYVISQHEAALNSPLELFSCWDVFSKSFSKKVFVTNIFLCMNISLLHIYLNDGCCVYEMIGSKMIQHFENISPLASASGAMAKESDVNQTDSYR